MGRIEVLDCTLRDGGYINSWNFGKEAIGDICQKSIESGVDIVELGFLRDVPEEEDKAVYASTDSISRIAPVRTENVIYAVMAEMASYFPPEKILPRNQTTFDMIRYTFWKRCIDEGYEYCKKIKEKGYELAVQPTRVEQYSDSAFAEMIKLFCDLRPYAIYIVDTFGLLTKDRLKHYADIAHNNMDKSIALGYHAHNNMQQAFENAVALTEMDLDRKTVIDVSAFGMGRGAGNLNAEVFLSFLNRRYKRSYNIVKIYEMWDMWLKDIYRENEWGYSLYYLITAYYKGNPNYASYFKSHNISVVQADQIMKCIPYEERIIFSEDKVKTYMEKINEKSISSGRML